jgi:hypothetical protein
MLGFILVLLLYILNVPLFSATIIEMKSKTLMIELEEGESASVGQIYSLLNESKEPIAKVKVKSVDKLRVTAILGKNFKGELKLKDRIYLGIIKAKKVVKEYSFSLFNEGKVLEVLGLKYEHLVEDKATLGFSLSKLDVAGETENAQQTGFKFQASYINYFSSWAFNTGFFYEVALGYALTKHYFLDQFKSEYEASMSGFLVGASVGYNLQFLKSYFLNLSLGGNYYAMKGEVTVEEHTEKIPLSGFQPSYTIGLGIAF